MRAVRRDPSAVLLFAVPLVVVLGLSAGAGAIHAGPQAGAAGPAAASFAAEPYAGPAAASFAAEPYAGPVAQLSGAAGPIVIAHRGGADLGPENTLPAFAAALEAGAAFVEADLRHTADGRIVLSHDEELHRTTDGNGLLYRLSFEELRRLDAGSWFAPEYAGTQVPTLEELLDLVEPSGATVILEIKDEWSPEEMAEVREQLRLRGMEDRAVIASFTKASLRSARAAMPELPRLLLRMTLDSDSVQDALDLGAAAIGTTPFALGELPGSAEGIRAAGLGLLLFTLNTEPGWQQALELGADGIVTNAPTALAAWLGGGAQGAG